METLTVLPAFGPHIQYFETTWMETLTVLPAFGPHIQYFETTWMETLTVLPAFGPHIQYFETTWMETLTVLPAFGPHIAEYRSSRTITENTLHSNGVRQSKMGYLTFQWGTTIENGTIIAHAIIVFAILSDCFGRIFKLFRCSM